MQLTVEISLYPLREQYVEPIQWFIDRLKQYPDIERVTNALSTQICGDYDAVMRLLGTEMKAAHEKWGKAVFVCKFLGGDFNLEYRQ